MGRETEEDESRILKQQDNFDSGTQYHILKSTSSSAREDDGPNKRAWHQTSQN